MSHVGMPALAHYPPKSPVKGKDGRSGGIRTHDPQRPMLVRYQAAPRSDRTILWSIARLLGLSHRPGSYSRREGGMQSRDECTSLARQGSSKASRRSRSAVS
jgi:hypothetical protein